MKKTIIAAFFLHIIVFAFVWVGFPVIHAKNNVSFYYSQLLMPIAQDFSVNTKIPIKADSGADDDVWRKVREINKPKR